MAIEKVKEVKWFKKKKGIFCLESFPDPQLSCLQCISSFLSSLRSLSFVLWVSGATEKFWGLLGFSFSQGCSKGVVGKLVELDSSWRTPALLDPWAPHPPTSPAPVLILMDPVLSLPLLEWQALTHTHHSLPSVQHGTWHTFGAHSMYTYIFKKNIKWNCCRSTGKRKSGSGWARTMTVGGWVEGEQGGGQTQQQVSGFRFLCVFSFVKWGF